jgi:uncharacterized protein related to proFAR isomerase
MQVTAAWSSICLALALSGCEKVPTFQELTSQEPPPAAAPKAAPPEQPVPAAASVSPPAVPVPMQTDNPEEVISVFKSKATVERNDADLVRLASLPSGLDSITQMDLTSAKGLTDVGLQQVGKFSSLEQLSLAGTQVTPSGISAVASLSRLKSLDLRGCPLNREALTAIAKAEQIERLLLASTIGGDGDLDTLANLPELRELDLSLRTISDESLKGLAGCQKLEVLLLQRDPINGSGLEFLKPKKGQAPPLRVLNVSSTRAGERGMPHLKGLETLEELIADDCLMTDAALLQNLKGMSRLRKISLGYNDISDFGTQALASIKSLEDVSLHACSKVGDKTLGHLKSHKKLRRLNLMGCRITPTALQAFRNLLPDCEVISN